MTTVALPDVRVVLGARTPRELTEHEKWAAVAMLLRDGSAGPEVLLIRRAEHPSDPWSGHMAFPGGRQAAEDPTLLHTAMRETREEVGLDLSSQAERIGQLDDLQAIARGKPQETVIRPFVFEVHRQSPIRVDEKEVAEALWTPLLPLYRGEVDTVRPYQWQGTQIDFPAYDVGGRVVWGLTYQMLRSFFRILG
ncbi:MAG: CoA pyrophosphatase [Polyangiales bacterium]|jgi:8-oxo-dGTP pyrophosphatase MutT (NUDIX family)